MGKRGEGKGYAGIVNELFYEDKCRAVLTSGRACGPGVA
jgi:NAD/NADP transhydrogenase beta subunit